MRTKNAITIKDLAVYVGLSVGTVSMALNDSDKINAKTKEIVKKAAKDIGFRKNPLARSFSLQSSGIIGCTVPDLTNNFYGEMISHLQADLSQSGYSLIVGCTNDSRRAETNIMEKFIEKGVDGIITVPVSDESKDLSSIQNLADSDFPIVFISSYYPSIPRYTVMCDLSDGMYQLTKKMVDQGHKNILIVSGSRDLIPSGERIRGFLKAMDECGIKTDERNFFEASKVTYFGGYSAINEVFFQRKPDLVMAINDIMAMGIISSLKSRKVRIPDDVSVAGFDDISISAFQETPLTTVSQSLGEMSEKAVNMLIRRIKGQSGDFGIEYVPAEVILRKSTRTI